jgi:hypothetical protein
LDLGGFEVFQGKAIGYNKELVADDAVSGCLKNQASGGARADGTGRGTRRSRAQGPPAPAAIMAQQNDIYDKIIC